MYLKLTVSILGNGRVKRAYLFMTGAFCLTFFVSLFVTTHLKAQQQENIEKQNVIAPLFSEEEPLELTIKANFKSLIANKDEDVTEYDSAQLFLSGNNSDDEKFAIKVRARGFSRRVSTICDFPPLLLNFKKKEVEGTVFDGQNKLKLVTFCRDMERYQGYVFHEYLIYKMYNILSDTSLRVRLTHITYKDIGKDKLRASNYGFLIEDIDDMAERLGGEESDRLLTIHDMCDHTSLDRFTIFQFMIGNVDWHIGKPMNHNTKIITINSSLPIPIPYDFDFCGAVNTSYAVTPSNLPITSVQQRLFRGFCRQPGEYDKTIQVFIDKKEEIYNLYLDFPYLSDNVKKNTLKYYDQFYDIVTDPKKVKKQIYYACPANHEHLYKM